MLGVSRNAAISTLHCRALCRLARPLARNRQLHQLSGRRGPGNSTAVQAPPLLHGAQRLVHCTPVMTSSSDNAPSGAPFPDIVTAEWLKPRIKDVKVLDASWYLPMHKRDGVAEFKADRLPGAQYFDIGRIADTTVDLPHMLPSARAFAAVADALGIGKHDTVVVYDRLGAFSAPRAWWTWHVFGHERVALLDGGLKAWLGVGGELETTPVSDEAIDAPVAALTAAAVSGSDAPVAAYPARLQADEVRDWRQVLGLIQDGKAGQVLDARPAARWAGTAGEPRAGLRAGHMPGSRSVPLDTVLTPEGEFKSGDELREIFNVTGADFSNDVTFSCGSGVTACGLLLAARRAHPGLRGAVYDGSWSEWGALPDVPVETSSA